MTDKRCKYPWPLMNWQLPNRDLFEVWQCGTTYLSTGPLISRRRKERGEGMARWAYAGPHRPDSTAYLTAISQEIEKAKAWREAMVQT